LLFHLYLLWETYCVFCYTTTIMYVFFCYIKLFVFLSSIVCINTFNRAHLIFLSIQSCSSYLHCPSVTSLMQDTWHTHSHIIFTAPSPHSQSMSPLFRVRTKMRHPHNLSRGRMSYRLKILHKNHRIPFLYHNIK